MFLYIRSQPLLKHVKFRHDPAKIIRLGVWHVKIIFPSAESVEESQPVKIAELHVFPRSRTVKFQDPAEISSWRDLVDRHVLRDIHEPSPVHADPIEADHDDILISPVRQEIHRHIVDTAAVKIRLSTQLFLLKSWEIGAGHHYILYGPQRCCLYIEVLLFPVRD